MKRLRPDEIDYLAHPERFTFGYFQSRTLDLLPEAAALLLQGPGLHCHRRLRNDSHQEHR